MCDLQKYLNVNECGDFEDMDDEVLLNWDKEFNPTETELCHPDVLSCLISMPSNDEDDKDKTKECDICHKMVKHIKKHLLTHSKEQPYKCSLCLRKFSQKSNLNRHTLSIHKENYITCKLCGIYRCKRRDKLKIHEAKCSPQAA